MSETVVSSARKTVVIGFDRPFCIIGERINPTGRKKLAAEMAAGDFSTVEKDALAQVEAGAHMLDVNAGIPLADEPAILAQTIQLVQSLTDVPLSIDSSIVAALEAGLAVYKGRPLVSVSAVGSLQDHLHPGELVVVDQFIDRTRGRPSTFFEEDVVAHVSLAQPTDPALSQCLARAAERAGARVHHAGTYLCMEGPQFSTRAESLLHRGFKADVIGMTALPEAKLAREAELPYASLCFVTDYDAWHDTEEAVSVDNVLAVLRKNVALGQRILREVRDWPAPEESPASSALRGAVITDPRCIGPAARERFALLIGKYLPVETP